MFWRLSSSALSSINEKNDFHLLLKPTAVCWLLCLLHADWMNLAAHVLHWCEWNRKMCCRCLECIILIVLATNLRSSACTENPSNSVIVLTVLVDDGYLSPELGSNAHVSNSSPQKSPGFKMIELKKSTLPPSVEQLSKCPRKYECHHLQRVSFTDDVGALSTKEIVHTLTDSVK